MLTRWCKRKGAFAIYLEPWHADVFEFLDLRKNHVKKNAVPVTVLCPLVSDLFMERVVANEDWSFICPHKAPWPGDCWGKELKNYTKKYGKRRPCP